MLVSNFTESPPPQLQASYWPQQPSLSWRTWQTFPPTCKPPWSRPWYSCSRPFCPCCKNSLGRWCLFTPCNTKLMRPCPTCFHSARRIRRMTLVCRLSFSTLGIGFTPSLLWLTSSPQPSCPKLLPCCLWFTCVTYAPCVPCASCPPSDACPEWRSRLHHRMCPSGSQVPVVNWRSNSEACRLESATWVQPLGPSRISWPNRWMRFFA